MKERVEMNGKTNTKKTKINETSCASQNKHNYTTAQSFIAGMSDKEKIESVARLEKDGYECNSYVKLLLEEPLVLPYNFLMLNLLKDSLI
jgi:hypothetical protein